jgi:leader peptidase (prepilin peptidase) / N-methyltransferase
MQQLITSDWVLWTIRVGAFIFGAIWGSFFNVAIFRWPRELSVVTPASYCPACGKPIPAYLNVPILGFFLIRGKAACCGAKISPRYALVETVSALLCVAVVERYIVHAQPSATVFDAIVVAVSYFAFVGGLVIVTFIDLEFMEIPDEVSLPMVAFGLVTAGFRETPGAEAAALGAGGSYLIIQMIFVWAYERLTGRRGMGEGDSKLLMMIGAFVGWQGALFSLMAGAVQGIVVVAISLLFGKSVLQSEHSENNDRSREHEGPSSESQSDVRDIEPSDEFAESPPKYIGHLKIPFGPFLALSALEFLFFGERLTDAYFGLF